MLTSDLPLETSFIERVVDVAPPPASGSFHWSSTSSHTTVNHHQEQLELTSSRNPHGISPFSTWVKANTRFDLTLDLGEKLWMYRGGGDRPPLPHLLRPAKPPELEGRGAWVVEGTLKEEGGRRRGRGK